MKKPMLILLIMTSFLSCKSSKNLPTEKTVDLKKYAGQWYEIARLPNFFEKGLKCITATYTLREDGKITVLNKGHRSKDKSRVKEAKGKAWRADPNYQGRLKVQFFWPFSGDYYIIHLDQDYQHVLIGSPNRKYLWILARNNKLDSNIYDALLNIARSQGFEVDKMITIAHDCD